MKIKQSKKLFQLTALASALIASTSALAGGFQLYEQDAEGLGTYHAGIAARADSAATEYNNPAGMVRLKHTSISAGGTFVGLRSSFNGEIGLTKLIYAPAHGNGKSNNVVPNMHVVVPFNYKGRKAAFGFGVNVPYGLSSSYPKSTLGNDIGLGGTNTLLMTVNIGPSFAINITPKLSVAAGVDFVWGQADYDGDIDIFTQRIGHYTTHLQGTGWGFNVGALWQPNQRTRVGMTYRSKVIISAHGPSNVTDFGVINNRSIANGKVPLPADFALSLYHDIRCNWSMMASVMYTQWSIFKTLNINNMAKGLPERNITVDYDYKDSWFASIGTQYWVNAKNGLSLGFGVDQTPTRDGYRDIRLPDGDRWAASVGWEYKFNPKANFSVGYSYVDMGKTDINNTKSRSGPYEKGTSEGHANLIGVQLNYSFS